MTYFLVWCKFSWWPPSFPLASAILSIRVGYQHFSSSLRFQHPIATAGCSLQYDTCENSADSGGTVGDVVRKGVQVDSATHVVSLCPEGFSWLLIASFSLGFAGLWKLRWRWESNLFHSVVKEKGLKYWDDWRTNDIAIVKDKKIVFLAISNGKHFSQTETIFSFVWGVYC